MAEGAVGRLHWNSPVGFTEPRVRSDLKTTFTPLESEKMDGGLRVRMRVSAKPLNRVSGVADLGVDATCSASCWLRLTVNRPSVSSCRGWPAGCGWESRA